MLQSLTSHDGLTLQVLHHQLHQARGCVLIVHGLGEHQGRYQA
ncbi:MAG: hypothetical protein RL722_2222, partial [Pseudomonadota bacterium]